ncbi:putative NADH-flavin reductase [Mucilaginibacter frigoritolerans]|uniref:Putative NADH-flavin reductase n=1 Tax=Mucilaginibacter frigoritolerans TaxID=652788 RepID=A0A562TMA7_9SPHI|nr:NAD(P)H-binding protein [Mucilaginibacter frigoritolerans]TWI94196.1 putative NADH-flavin reductase [Mucilaginibacter frigoritolerans]
MKILILGATGRTGSLLLKEAIKQGYVINVLVCDKNKLQINSPLLTVFEGTPADKEALLPAMQGCNAILSTLNISRTSDFPWAPLRSPENLLSASMKNIIELANQLNIKRVIITTAWGVNETKKDLPGWFRWLIDHSNIGYPYRDHERQEDLLKQSTLSWTIVRPVGLTNSVKHKAVQVSINNSPKPGLTISRQNVAHFMIKVLQEGSYVNEAPAVWG